MTGAYSGQRGERNGSAVDADASAELAALRLTQLVEGFRASDPTAFAELYAIYFDFVYAYVAALMRNHHESEEIVQDAFEAAILRSASFRGSASMFRPWLVRIAHNKALDALKKAGRISNEDPAEIRARHEANGEARIDPALQLREWISDPTLFEAVSSLSLAHRQVILLRFGLGFRCEETARILGGTEGYARTLQHRALKALTERLVQMGYRRADAEQVSHHSMRARVRFASVLARRRQALRNRLPAALTQRFK